MTAPAPAAMANPEGRRQSDAIYMLLIYVHQHTTRRARPSATGPCTAAAVATTAAEGCGCTAAVHED